LLTGSRRIRALARSLETVLLPLALGAAVIALWSALVTWTGTKVFPSPLKVLEGLGELWRRGVLLSYLRDSLARVAAGYGAGVLVGVPLGIWMGWSRTVAAVVNPLIQILRPISPIAWIPVAIVLFGVSNLAPVFLVFLGAVFPIVVTAMNGVGNVPEVYLRAAHNLGLSQAALLFRVILPASLPQILTGLRIALGIAWLVVVAAEMVAVDSGLGYLIIDARNAGKRYDLVVAGMMLIGLVGLFLDVLVRRLERVRALRWGFRTPE
jgi:NitT/TauT family transport system permease protein